MYDSSQLAPYSNAGSDLIPVHTWNKKIEGKEYGKIPVGDDWQNKSHKAEAHLDWIAKGYNVGFRISDEQLVIDIDPRNFDLELDSEQTVAELLGYDSLDDALFDIPSVRTGGGGWHLYLSLPFGVTPLQISETVKEIPGVEFKKHGRQVLAAGSRHPSGEMYEWETEPEKGWPVISEKLLNAIKRSVPPSGKYSSGKGALNGAQLKLMVLNKLDPRDYGSYDAWFPVMAACHHATNGDAADEFVAWCVQDPNYSDSETDIRNCWERLWDKENAITIGTLIQKLDLLGEDSSQVRAALDFQNSIDSGSFADDDDTEEAKMMLDAEMVASQIDLGELTRDPEFTEGVDGKALAMAKRLTVSASEEDLMKCIRLIKAAGSIEADRAVSELTTKKIIAKASVTKILKELETRMAEDLGSMLNKKTLEIVFNGGKYLTLRPNGELYMFSKTHWEMITDEFLGKISRKTLSILRERIDIDTQELGLITQSIRLCRLDSATKRDRIYDPTRPVRPVINCKNGELWIERDGTHRLKPHSYRSYLTSCLPVDYDPSAECPLFLKTLHEIFDEFVDTGDMVRHMLELMGYIAQPIKNLASFWMFRGPGGDGKSTILKVLGAVLGDAMLMSNVKLLNAVSAGGDNHAMDSLVSRLGVVIEELPVRTKLNDEMVKMLSENTKMLSNPKHTKPFDFIYCGTLIACSNGYPRIEDLSRGMMRRVNVVPFNRQFDTNNIADIDRAANIIADPKEMSGVLNLMLEGLKRLRDRGKFRTPESCLNAKDFWLGESNNIVKFVQETIELESGAYLCDYGSLYDIHYQLWCQNYGIEDKMRKKKIPFGKELSALGMKIQRGGAGKFKVYGGRLKKKDDDFDEEIDFSDI